MSTPVPENFISKYNSPQKTEFRDLTIDRFNQVRGTVITYLRLTLILHKRVLVFSGSGRCPIQVINKSKVL